MGYRVVTNPHKILSHSVAFRNSKGRFTKPHLAVEFTVKIAGLSLDFNIPKFRPKTKLKVLNYVMETVQELKNQLYVSEVAAIEERLKKKPKKLAKKPLPTKIPFTYKESDHIYFAKRAGVQRELKSYYFWFNTPFAITKKSSVQIMKQVYIFAYNRLVEVLDAHPTSFKGWRHQIKILGGGTYYRMVNKGSTYEPKPDIFGFAEMMQKIPKNREDLKKLVAIAYETFMDTVVNGKDFMDYFRRMTEEQLEASRYDRYFYVFGVKLTFVRDL